VTPLAAPEIARRIADALESADIPHAIGGALALAVWGFPRATNDVDVDVFLPVESLGPALEALRQAELEFDAREALERARERGDFRARAGSMRVDVFVSSIPFYDAVRRRIRRAPLMERPAWFLSPEDLVVFKLLFFRTKDLLDVERLVTFLADDFDRAYVRRWLVELVGESDERIAAWEAIVTRARAG
jgi:hypothetical protein